MSLIATTLDPGVSVLAEGVLPWINRKGTEAQDSMRTVAVLVALGFVIFNAFKSRGAMSAILVSGLVAGVFLWIVWSVTAIKDRVGDELNNTSMPAVTAPLDPSAPPAQVPADGGPR